MFVRIFTKLAESIILLSFIDIIRSDFLFFHSKCEKVMIYTQVLISTLLSLSIQLVITRAPDKREY